MASEVGGGEAFGGSLFDGMVLFTTSDLSQPPSSTPPMEAPPPPSPSPPPSPPPSEPLDEDLFSDLTLQIPIQPLLSTISRQASTSRKKKRAIRIGYGRHAGSSTDETPLPLPDTLEISSRDETPLPDPLEVSSRDETPLPDPLEVSSRDSTAQIEDSPHPHLDTDSITPLHLVAVDHSASHLDNGASRHTATVNGGSSAVLESGGDHGITEKEDVFSLMEGKLHLVKSHIFEKLECVRERAASVYAEKKELIVTRRKATEDVRLASNRYKELEEELEEACEAEDFERAERVSESLVALEKEKDGFLRAMRDVELECDTIDSKMQEILELLIAEEEDGVAMLEQFAKDASGHADLVLKEVEEVSSKQIEELQSSMESLVVKKLEIDVESHLVLEARLGLEYSMEQLVKDDRKEEDTLRSKQVSLSKELEELLELVRLKEAEISDNDSKIREVERRISDVFSDFRESQSNIDMQHEKLQSARLKIELECEALLTKRRDTDEFLSLAEEKKLKLRELASVSLEESRTFRDSVEFRKKLASSMLKSSEDKTRFARKEVEISEDVQILKQQISAARNTLQELSSSRASIEQEIASIKQRIDHIEKRGPELEAEKKVAAASRNFKEAGRIAAEAKALNLEKENLHSKKHETSLLMMKVDEEISITLDKINEGEKVIMSKEREAAMAVCERLRLVAAISRAERSASASIGDDEEGEVLLHEAEAAELKAKELQEAYELELEENGISCESFVPITSIISLKGPQLAEMVASSKAS